MDRRRSSNPGASTYKIEKFDSLFPTPKERLVRDGRAHQNSPPSSKSPVAIDPTSSQKSEQLPVYHAYCPRRRSHRASGLRQLRIPADYEELARMGISVNGAIVIAKYGGLARGINTKVAAEHWRAACIVYSDPKDDGYATNDIFPLGPPAPARRRPNAGSVMDMPSILAIPSPPASAQSPDRSSASPSPMPDHHQDSVLPMSYARRPTAPGRPPRPPRSRRMARRTAHHLSHWTRPPESAHEGSLPTGIPSASTT